MLTLIPTPIGNLEDITLRALRVLREADIIACEDTRTSSVLLRHYDINNKILVPFHLHNENKVLNNLLNNLRDGKNIAVISDAGTPGISDPGWILLKRAIDLGLDVDVLPGPTACIPAVLLSGLQPQPFLFYGFVPEKASERVKLFNELKNFKYTLCFYVSPHKASKDIQDVIKIFGDRDAALVREISKIFQESIRGSLSHILNMLETQSLKLKGEMVLVIAGAGQDEPEIDNDQWQQLAREMRAQGLSVKDIASDLSDKFNLNKNKVKDYLNNLKI
ncbi:MAG: 16S rRNA (cytidine(1402)-2'-O)-methyltransferase [Synergistaceae bacterium]|nr:16S rRNA (cytidine(1402)-2'-O)-methyltransferase [Synergistaceae bacterium]